jgi:hypothetical protein
MSAAQRSGSKCQKKSEPRIARAAATMPVPRARMIGQLSRVRSDVERYRMVRTPWDDSVASRTLRLAAAGRRPAWGEGRFPQAGRRIAAPRSGVGLDPRPAPYHDVRTWVGSPQAGCRIGKPLSFRDSCRANASVNLHLRLIGLQTAFIASQEPNYTVSFIYPISAA